MSKIKYIHCFGTSYSAGGGYEFYSDSPSKRILLPLYKDIGEELTRYNFSYAGQLQKLFKENGQDIKVINHAKSGFGNERMYRLTFDIISKPDFKKEEHLFFYEFSFTGRKEFYMNQFNDYVIFNYHLDENRKFKNVENALSYFEESRKDMQKNREIKERVTPFFEEMINVDNQEYLIEMYDTFFCNFLKNNNINFNYSQAPWLRTNLFSVNDIFTIFEKPDERNETLRFFINDNDSEYDEGFVGFFHTHDLTITKETHGLVDDGHMGLYGSKIVASQIYNQLIDAGTIVGNKIPYPDKIILPNLS